MLTNTTAPTDSIIREAAQGRPRGPAGGAALGGIQPPLFCIHELTGNVICHRLLASRLDDDQPVYGLQYPGQDLAEPPPLGLEEMATRYLDTIRSVQAAGSYYLLGFSLGGVIAYEIARRLCVP